MQFCCGMKEPIFLQMVDYVKEMLAKKCSTYANIDWCRILFAMWVEYKAEFFFFLWNYSDFMIH